MFDPIRALFASSFSKKGINEAATETNCFGDTSTYSIVSGFARMKLSDFLHDTSSSVKRPSSFINELALIFDRLGIDTHDVLDAALTKWNFLDFKPGLVGGHCISVDPYYLAYKAESVGYSPEVILSGRRINDHMGQFVASKIVKLISQARLSISRTRIIVFGVTFKEDCADVRNSQVFTLIKELEGYGFKVSAVDPLADVDAVVEESGLALSSVKTADIAPVVVLAVPHQAFLEKGFKWLNGFIEKPGLLIDVKSVFRRDAAQIDDLTYWGL